MSNLATWASGQQTCMSPFNVHNVISELSDEVNGLVKVLVQFNNDKEASKLQETFGSFLNLIDTSVPSIWLDEAEDEGESVVS